jgi:hypothetical protein
MKVLINKIKNFFIENPLVTLLFVLSTAFFLIQHYFDFGWDFAAYIINAKYLFYGGNYYEVYRAPLISIIFGPLLLLGKVSQYLYIFLVSSLFLFSVKKLVDALHEKYFIKFNITKKTTLFLFYFFSLNFFVLFFAFLTGTELLAISFFQLFLAYFILNKNSGHWLALAFLSRYNFFVFVPFLFFNKSIKQIGKNLGLFFIISFPWLLFNKIHWGNFFTSIADAFYLNVFSRLDRWELFHFKSLSIVTNWFLPFLIIGLLVPIILLIRSKDRKISSYKYEILFATIFLFFFYDIYTIPFKIVRYMFNMALPIAFFSTLGSIFIIKNLRKKYLKKIFTILLLIGFLISLIILGQHYFKIEDQDVMYIEAAQGIEALGLTECQILSPHWVPVNYYTGNVRFMPYSIDGGLQAKEIMLIFYHYPTMDDQFNLSEIDQYPQLKRTDNYMIIANENTTAENCIKTQGHSSPMISAPCEILSKKFSSKFTSNAFLKTCRAVNYLDF